MSGYERVRYVYYLHAIHTTELKAPFNSYNKYVNVKRKVKKGSAHLNVLYIHM